MRNVWTFFYGSFMNPKVLSQAEVFPTDPQRGRLDGWDIVIAPRATLRPSDNICVYGILAKVSHPELDRLYAKDWFGFGSYVHEAVNVVVDKKRSVPAMCYVAWDMEPGYASNDYIEKLMETAIEYGFPEWYISKIKSYAG